MLLKSKMPNKFDTAKSVRRANAIRSFRGVMMQYGSRVAQKPNFLGSEISRRSNAGRYLESFLVR
jgi:hypothetical protein